MRIKMLSWSQKQKKHPVPIILWLLPQAKKGNKLARVPPWYKTNPATPGHNYINFKHSQMTSFKH